MDGASEEGEPPAAAGDAAVALEQQQAAAAAGDEELPETIVAAEQAGDAATAVAAADAAPAQEEAGAAAAGAAAEAAAAAVAAAEPAAAEAAAAGEAAAAQGAQPPPEQQHPPPAGGAADPTAAEATAADAAAAPPQPAELPAAPDLAAPVLPAPESDGGGSDTHHSGVTSASAGDGSARHDCLSPQASSGGSRPGSAAVVRGSRPNSAAIAAQIEGFDTDFLGLDEHARGLLDEVPEDDDAADAGPTTEQLVQAAQQELAALLEVNDTLQQHARQVLDVRNQGRPPINRDLSRLDGADTRYRSALKQWTELRQERERVTAHYQTSVLDMKTALEGRIQRAEEIGATFRHFQREVALASEHGKTGRPLAEKAVAALEARDQVMEEEVQRVRLKNIHLANALKKLDATIRNKERLAEGLHLIDFEQLKIENQSLNEKIEQRNDELVKLRRKTTVTVQILTHMKEKLHFLESDNAALQAQLAEVEAALAGRRDELASLKVSRDRLRAQGRKLKEQTLCVQEPLLLQDMQAQKEARDDLLAEIQSLKQQHAAVSASAGTAAAAAAASHSGSRGGAMPASAPPGALRRPSRGSKAASVELHVGAAAAQSR